VDVYKYTELREIPTIGDPPTGQRGLLIVISRKLRKSTRDVYNLKALMNAVLKFWFC